MTDTLFYSMNGRFDLKNVESTLESDLDRKQCLLGPHLHRKKLSDAFHCRVINDDLFHFLNARTVRSLPYKEGSGLPAQQ